MPVLILAGLVSLAAAGYAWVALSTVTAVFWFFMTWIVAVVAFWIGMALLVVALGLMAVPFALAQVWLLFFGTDLLPLAARYEFSVEETPPGRHVVEQLSFVNNKSLLHSAAYTDARVPPLIGRWLLEEVVPQSV